MTTPQTITGWDIGIKNLACCKLSKLPPNGSSQAQPAKNVIHLNGSQYQIHHWEVINVVPKVGEIQAATGEIMFNSRPTVTCACSLNSGKICGKKAVACKIAVGATGEYYGYCTVHYKKLTAETVAAETVPIKTGSCACHYMRVDGRCGGKGYYIRPDNQYVGYCKAHANLLMKGVGLEPPMKLIKVVRDKKTTSLNLTSLAEALYTELGTRPDILKSNTVLLENQPVLKNPTMKTMQVFLYGYYVQNGVMQRSVDTVHCYCASKKLDILKFLPIERIRAITDELKTIKGQYTRNKRMAIRICEYLIETATNAEEIRTLFADKKKQDDLADSMLMTLHYEERANLTTAGSKKNKTGSGNGGNTMLSKEELAMVNELLSSLAEPTTIEEPEPIDSDGA